MSETYFDNADWHFEDAHNVYSECFMNKHPQAYIEWQATKKDIGFIEHCEEAAEAVFRRAAFHMGVYMAWIIRYEFEGKIHKEESADDLEKVRNRQMTGTEFILKRCDGKLWAEDLNEEGLAFTRSYYEEHYLMDFADLALGIADGPYTLEDGWENYQEFAQMLDEAYENWKKGKPGRVR